MNHTLFATTLPKKTQQLAHRFQTQKPSFLTKFYLSGGSALSLHIGHRMSEDLDFFSQESFDPEKLVQTLRPFGNLTETEIAEGTLNTFLNQVKLQFLAYPYALLKPTTNWKGIRISSVIDIACTKLQTIGSRGSKKDFVDLYFLLQLFSLQEMLTAMKKKYADINYSQTHILKSLVYFADADNQPMPRMHKTVSWTDIKKHIISTVKAISFQ